MASTPECTLAAPAGFLSLIEKKATRAGWDHATLLRRAGVSAAEYAALAAALAQANGETWRRLSNTVRSQVLIVEQTTQIREGADGIMTAASHGYGHTSAFGDLTG